MSNPGRTQTHNPTAVHPPQDAYSHVSSYTLQSSSAAKIITTAGQIGVSSDGTTAKTFEEQVKLALANVESCLSSAGATKKDIMKTTLFVVGFDRDSRNPVATYTDWLEGHKPAATLISVARLAGDDLLFEVEAMAIVPA